MESYRKQRFPKNFGLYDTGLITRLNTPGMIAFNDLWFKELDAKSKRDQLSHPYCIWKTGIKIDTYIAGTKKGASPYLKKRKHKIGRIKPGSDETKKRDFSNEVLNRKIAFKMRRR